MAGTKLASLPSAKDGDFRFDESESARKEVTPSVSRAVSFREEENHTTLVESKQPENIPHFERDGEHQTVTLQDLRSPGYPEVCGPFMFPAIVGKFNFKRAIQLLICLLLLLGVWYLRNLTSSGKVYPLSPELEVKANCPLQQLSLEVRIMQTPLSSYRSVDNRLVAIGSGLIKQHDYIAVKIGPSRWIKAEKQGPNSGVAGIHVRMATGPGAGKTRFAVEISGVAGTLGHFLDLLRNDNPDYNPLTDNCWKYAYFGVEAILKWSICNAVNDTAQDELIQALCNLEDVRRLMPFELANLPQVWVRLKSLFAPSCDLKSVKARLFPQSPGKYASRFCGTVCPRASICASAI